MSEGAKISPEGKILLLPNGRQGRRPFEAQGRISRSAERDLRLCLKNSPPFEKGGPKLSTCHSGKVVGNG